VIKLKNEYNGNRSTCRILKISTATSFVMLAIALIILASEQAQGYEISIYQSTNILLWVSVFFGICNGFILLVLSLREETRRLWVLGAFQIVFCNCILISLYALKGYFQILFRGDLATYLGMIKDITVFGSISPDNVYPLPPILFSQLEQVSSLSPLMLSKILPSLFFIIYFIGIICWSKEVLNDKKYVALVTISSIPLFFAWFSPTIYFQMLSVWTLPLFFFIIYRCHTHTSFKVLFFIMCFVYPFWHPITSIFTCVYLGSVYAYEQLFSRKKPAQNHLLTLTLLFFAIVCLLFWMITQLILLKSATRVFEQIIGLLEGYTTADVARYYITRLGFVDTLRSAYLMFNDDLIYYLLSIVGIAYVLKNKKMKERFLPIIICLVVGSLLLFLFFFFARIHTVDRLLNLNFNMVFTPFLVGLVFLTILNTEKSRKKTILVVVLSGLVLLSTLTAMVSLYQSPLTIRPNDQTTESEIQGANWLISNKEFGVNVANILSPLCRYSDFIYGHEYTKSRKDLDLRMIMPDHFGSVGYTLSIQDKDVYIVVTTFDKYSYSVIWQSVNRFSKSDFTRLNFYSNCYQVYDSINYEVYFNPIDH